KRAIELALKGAAEQVKMTTLFDTHSEATGAGPSKPTVRPGQRAGPTDVTRKTGVPAVDSIATPGEGSVGTLATASLDTVDRKPGAVSSRRLAAAAVLVVGVGAVIAVMKATRSTPTVRASASPGASTEAIAAR